jgi:hypothetical protein
LIFSIKPRHRSDLVSSKGPKGNIRMRDILPTIWTIDWLRTADKKTNQLHRTFSK